MTEDQRTVLRGRCTPEQAWAVFDELPAAPVSDVTTGRWRGSEIDTGHPWAGVLVESGWYGKQFDSADAVHPLLFSDENGSIFAVDPRRAPLGLAGRFPATWLRPVRNNLRFLAPALRTKKPTARLRDIEYRGVVSAAMVYDHLPIIDHFRRLDEDALLGVMDMRGLAEPYFFLLER
ncbi:DUF4334 domain-containing protein [Nocardia cyriacigeorgica]|uniref:DUF4334 domain-containing protein n=1 Tax=Nocardia cyriacigeorgica TaxID=135487 RepID=UPI002454D21A|nr:DUF4334 domain-containing protein [Nocardia cyriacigeorgica]